MLLAGVALVLATALTLDVAPGDDLAAALRRAKPGDTLVLARGRHHGALPALAGLTVTGAGAGETVLEVPEGSRGAVVVGAVTITGLTVRAGPRQCALVVEGGAALLRDVALAGGACGALVSTGALHGDGVHLRGGWHGLLVAGGEARLRDATVHGGVAGVAVQRGSATLERSTIFGPSREAAVTVTGGEATLLASVVLSPGPAGLAVTRGALRAEASTVWGAGPRGGPSTCAEALGGELRLAGSELRHCGGAALEASRAVAVLDGLDVEGGAAGCLALIDGARADLQGIRCSGRGPGLFVGSGAQAELRHDRWLVDPTMVVECATGARVRLGAGEAGRQPCPGGVAPPDAGH
ncbi:MAG TPA: hypothetical protein VEM76_15915 [Anaeromyxobacteraceae bacterium]|nr:hypothetical protein [Anaeromyxobacteraceae bacterium]